MKLVYKKDDAIESFTLVSDLQPFGNSELYFKDLGGAGTFGYLKELDFVHVEGSNDITLLYRVNATGVVNSLLQVDRIEKFGSNKLYVKDLTDGEFYINFSDFIGAYDATP